MRSTLILFGFALLLAACGAKKPQTAAPPPPAVDSSPWGVWYAAVSTQVQQGFVVPPSIGPDELKRLSVDIAAEFDANGQVKKATVARSSGDQLFDRAALDAVERFAPGSTEKVALPEDYEAKRRVLTGPTRFHFRGQPAS